MALYRNRKILHRIVDFLMPNNCRVNLKKAAASNANACFDVVCLLREHNAKQGDTRHVQKAAAIK